jgi:hypothetical protein
MVKWADYLISQVSYDQNHIITKVKQHRDTGNKMGDGEIVDRDVLTGNLGHGVKYMTVYGDLNKIRMGKYVRYFRAYEHHYIRTDGNKVMSDDLGDIPNLNETKQEEKPALTETKPKPNAEAKPLSALSSAFFSEQLEVEVTPVPTEVVSEPTEVVEKKIKKTIMKTSAKKKPSRKKTSAKKKPSRKKTSAKKKPSKKKRKR